MKYRPSVLLVLAVLLVAACSGPTQTAGQNGPSAEEETEAPAPPPVYEFETFDASAYPIRPPESSAEIDHQVPGRLMRGRADEGVQRTLEGFRIQVFSAQDKQSAQNFREQVDQWWNGARGEAPAALSRGQTPIVVMYSQPYYRVRIGAFADRAAAEAALDFVRSEYPNAFIARSTVTVTR